MSSLQLITKIKGIEWEGSWAQIPTWGGGSRSAEEVTRNLKGSVSDQLHSGLYVKGILKMTWVRGHGQHSFSACMGMFQVLSAS